MTAPSTADQYVAEHKQYVAEQELAEKWAALAAPFPLDQIEKLPKPFSATAEKGKCDERHKDRNGHWCGGYHGLPAIHLDYVGHAGVTERLNSVDPTWTWRPMFRDVNPQVLAAMTDPEVMRQYIANAPMLRTDGGLWIELTVLGVTRPGFGDASGKSGANATKELIGDALRNAAMRFGVATYLWSKSEASAAKVAREDGVDLNADPPTTEPAAADPGPARERPARQSGPPADPVASIRSQIGRWAAANGISTIEVEARYLNRFPGTAIFAETNPSNLQVFFAEWQKDRQIREVTRRWLAEQNISGEEAQDRYHSEFGYGSQLETNPTNLQAFLDDWQKEVALQRGTS